MGMRVDIVTLFPEMCQQVLDVTPIPGLLDDDFDSEREEE